MTRIGQHCTDLEPTGNLGVDTYLSRGSSSSASLNKAHKGLYWIHSCNFTLQSPWVHSVSRGQKLGAWGWDRVLMTHTLDQDPGHGGLYRCKDAGHGALCLCKGPGHGALRLYQDPGHGILHLYQDPGLGMLHLCQNPGHGALCVYQAVLTGPLWTL